MRIGWLLTLWPLLCALPAQAGFGLHAASHLGFGRMGNETTATPMRSMGTFNIMAMPGYHFLDNLLLAGLAIDARLMSQLDNQNQSGGIDYSGNGLLLGIAAGVDLGPARLLLGYDLRARHSFTSSTASSSTPYDTTYKGSGFRFHLAYTILAGWGADLSFVQTSYNTSQVGELETPLSANPVTHWNLGFGISYAL